MPRQREKERARARGKRRRTREGRRRSERRRRRRKRRDGGDGAKEKEDERGASSKTLAVRGTMNGASAIKVRSLKKMRGAPSAVLAPRARAQNT